MAAMDRIRRIQLKIKNFYGIFKNLIKKITY